MKTKKINLQELENLIKKVINESSIDEASIDSSGRLMDFDFDDDNEYEKSDFIFKIMDLPSDWGMENEKEFGDAQAVVGVFLEEDNYMFDQHITSIFDDLDEYDEIQEGHLIIPFKSKEEILEDLESKGYNAEIEDF